MEMECWGVCASHHALVSGNEQLRADVDKARKERAGAVERAAEAEADLKAAQTNMLALVSVAVGLSGLQ